MITAGEVGAIFKIEDLASPVLKRLADQFTALQATIDKTKAMLDTIKMPPGLNRSLANFQRNLKGIDDQAGRTAETVTAAFGKIDGSIDTTAASVAALKREMSALGRDAARIGGVAAGSVRYGGSERASGVHFGAQNVPLPGDQHARLAGGPLMAIGGAVAYGTWEEAKVEDSINRMAIAAGLGGMDRNSAFYKNMRQGMFDAYALTGMSIDEMEEGSRKAINTLSGLSANQKVELIRQLLPLAATEAYLKPGTTIDDAMEVFTGLAHMEGKYSLEQVAAMAKHFAYVSTTTPVSMGQLSHAASYAVTDLRYNNFDSEQLITMIAAMERGGIQNTKAGTWLDALAKRSFPGTSLMSREAYKRHQEALRMLGIENPNVWKTNGVYDLDKLMEVVGPRLEAMSDTQRLGVETALWGAQGGRAAGFFMDPTNRAIMRAVALGENNMHPGEDMWDAARQNSALVAGRVAFAEMNIELMNLGANILPYVTGILRQANQQLGGKGELATIGAAILGWAKGGLRGAAGGVAGVGAYLGGNALLHWLIPDKAAQEAQLDDLAKLGPLQRAINHVVSSVGAPYPDGYESKPFAYLNNQNLQGIGNVPPRSMVQPQVTVNDAPKIDVKVYLDGAAIGAKVITAIVKEGRVVTSSADFDGRSLMGPPDAYNF